MGLSAFYTDPVDRYVVVDNAAARTALANKINGLQAYEQDTLRTYTWNGSSWFLTNWPKEHIRIYNSADQNVAPSGWTYLTCTAATFNYGSMGWGWHINIPHAGLWRIKAKARVVMANNPQHLIMALMTDGALYWRGTELTMRGVASGDSTTLNFDETISLGAAVTIYIQIYNGNANTCLLIGGAEFNHFEAEFVGGL